MSEDTKVTKSELANTLAILFSMQGHESDFMKMSVNALTLLYVNYNKNAIEFNHMEDRMRAAQTKEYISRQRRKSEKKA